MDESISASWGGLIVPRFRNIALGALLISVAFVFGRQLAEPDTPSAKEADEAKHSAPSEWAATQRLYPFWMADPAVYSEAAEQVRRLPKASTPGWTPGWSLAGPEHVAGRIVDVEYNPRSPDSIYAAAATGGVFLSVDGGSHWNPIFDGRPSLSIGDIAIDPTRPNVVYVGTGEANGGHNNLPGAGLFKSTDGGATWSSTGLQNTISIARVVIDPLNTNRVFAAVVGSYFAPGAERGVYRSTDGGASWQQILATNPDVGAIDLVLNPSNPNTVYAAMWERVRTYESQKLAGTGSGIYRSYNGGETWTRLGAANGLPDGSNVGRIGLALCATAPNVLYALFNDGTRYLGVFRTDDGGDKWVDADVSRQARTATLNFGWYFGQIRVNPADPDDAYVLDVRLAHTSNGGSSWALRALNLHVDFHALAFHPTDPASLIVGTDGGAGLSTDSANSWIRNVEMPTTQFYRSAVDAQDPDRMLGGTQDNGTLKRDPDTGLWQPILGGDGFAPLIDPTNPDVVYIQSQNGILRKSVDGGDTSISVATPARGIPQSDPRNWSTPVAMDPSNPAVIYYGTNRVYRSGDAAESWHVVSPVLPLRSSAVPPLGTITSIAVAPSDPTVVFAGTDDGRVWVSLDPNTDWVDVSAGLPERWVTEVAIDPVDPLTAYVTFSGLKWHDPQPHVFRTSNGGAEWTDISSSLPDLPVNTIVIDPDVPARLIVGTDMGAFVSEDAGGAWAALAQGMPAVAVYDLDIHKSTRRLFASTHGRSVYSLQLPSVPLRINADDLPSAHELGLNAWPNPFRDHLNIEIVGSGRGQTGGPLDLPHVPIRIFDIRGRLVRTLSSVGAGSSPGSMAFRWDGLTATGQPAPAGAYLVTALPPLRQARASATVIRSGHD